MVAIHFDDSNSGPFSMVNEKTGPDPNYAKSVESHDGFITVVRRGKRTDLVIQKKGTIENSFRATVCQNNYGPLCTHSAENNDVPPNMVGPFHQEPVPVQASTERIRDRYRKPSEFRVNGTKYNNKKRNKKHNKKHRKPNIPTKVTIDDFPYHLVDNLIEENNRRIKDIINRHTPIDNCMLFRAVTKLNMETRNHYIKVLRSKIMEFKQRRQIKITRRVAYCNSATATAVTIIRNRLSNMFRHNTPDTHQNRIIPTTENVNFGNENYISPNTSYDNRSDILGTSTGSNDDDNNNNNIEENEIVTNTTTDNEELTNYNEYNNIDDGITNENNTDNTIISEDFLPNTDIITNTNPTVVERLQHLERIAEQRIDDVINSINLFPTNDINTENGITYQYQTPANNHNIVFTNSRANHTIEPTLRSSLPQATSSGETTTFVNNERINRPPTYLPTTTSNIINGPSTIPLIPMVNSPRPNIHTTIPITQVVRNIATNDGATSNNNNQVSNDGGNGGAIPPINNDNDPDDSPSDDSSSTSSTDDDSNDSIGNHFSNSQHDDNDPPSLRATSERSVSTRDIKIRTASKILGEISKNAGRIEFPSLVYHTDPERRKLQFIKFSQALQYCSALTKELEYCFRDLDKVKRSSYPNANQALFTFILSRVDTNFFNILTQLASENEEYRNNGHTAYKHILKICLPSDIEDKNSTLTNFLNMSMAPNEHISQFVARYNRQHDLLKRCGIKKSTGSIIDHFLQKVIHIRVARLQLYISITMNKRKEERSAHRHTELSLMVIQQELCRDYDLELQQNRRTQNFTTTMPPIRHSRANVVHRTHTNQQSRDSRFNNNKNKSSITCYGCNRTGHSLKECRSTSSQKKREIFNRINGINNRNNHNINATTPHQHNNTRPPTTIAANAITSDSTVATQPTSNTTNVPIIRTEGSSHRQRSSANHARRAYCNMAFPSTHDNVYDSPYDSPYFLSDSDLPSRPVLYNQEVILDSGASDHMANTLDVLYNLHPTYVDVQLPDGSLCPCTQAGNMLVSTYDKITGERRLLELKEVLYVPGFTLCLWSVTAFTQHGHSVEFDDDSVHITLFRNQPDALHITLEQPFQQQQQRKIFANMAQSNKKKISIEIMHKRLGHCAFNSLLLASNDDLYNDVTITQAPTGFCSGCHIGAIRRARRGNHPVGPTTQSGLVWFLDIIKNPYPNGITRQSYSQYYLNMVDSYSRYQVLHPLPSITTAAVINALMHLESTYRPRDNFTIDQIQTIHTDAGSQFLSAQFRTWCQQHGIALQSAAPAHQEQNGTCESAWSDIRAIVFQILSEARLDHRFYDHALIYAWQIKNVLPLRGLSTPINTDDPTNLRQCTPFEKYFDKKPNISRYHVFGCPCVAKVNRRTPNNAIDTPDTLTNQNIIQRGVRGIFIGFPLNQSGYNIYLPQAGSTIVSLDVAFDENFSSPLSYPNHMYHDALPTRISNSNRTTIGPISHTGPPNVTMDDAPTDSPWTPYTAMDPIIPYIPQALPPETHIDEYHINENPIEEEDTSDDDLFGDSDDDSHTGTTTNNISTNSQVHPTNTSEVMISDNSHSSSNHHDPHFPPNNDDDDTIIFYLEDSDDEHIQQLDHSSNNIDVDVAIKEEMDYYPSDNTISFRGCRSFQEEEIQSTSQPTTESQPSIIYQNCYRRSKPPPLRRSSRSVKHTYDFDNYVYSNMYNKSVNNSFANYFSIALNAVRKSHLTKDEACIITSDIVNASNPYTNINNIGTEGSDPVYFLPEPRCLAEVIKLPVTIRKAWLKAFTDEFSGLISKGTVRVISKEEMKTLTKTTPVMDIYKCKLDQNGLIEKLKCRIVFRGDLYQPSTPEDSWNPFASYMALRVFLALCAKYNMPISSADWVQAYLQCDMSPNEEVYIQFPSYWSEFLPKHLGVYCGRPLRLLKALYGYTYSGKRLYESQESFMEGQGFKQSTLLGLWYKHLTNGGVFLVLIFADDQLIATTDPNELVQYKANLEKHFEIQWHPHAHWFLKARINRDQYGDITIDQNRYSKSIVRKYIPNAPSPPSEKDIAKYRNPTPNNFIWKKSDCSSNIKEVAQLEDQFQFRFIEVVGSLIFLANTAVRQLYAIRKLCKFMHLPGRRHFEALSHMLNHLRCHPARALKYYHDVKKSPLYQHIQTALPNERINPTLVYFTDSAFQDCEDKRSTGCYIGFLQGGVIDMVSTVPLPIASSTAEAETSFASITYLNSIQVARVYMEIVNKTFDNIYTVPILTDSSATIAIAANQRGTSNTKHMSRRQLLVRQGQNMGHIKLFHVKGKSDQIADIGTKSGIPANEFEYKLSICETNQYPDNTPPHY